MNSVPVPIGPVSVEYTDTLPISYAYAKWIPHITYEGRAVWVGCRTEEQKARCLRLYGERAVMIDLTFQEWIFQIGVNIWFSDLQRRLLSIRQEIVNHVLLYMPSLDTRYISFLTPQMYYSYYQSIFDTKAINLRNTASWEAFHQQLQMLVDTCVPVYSGPFAAPCADVPAGIPVSMYMSTHSECLCIVTDTGKHILSKKQEEVHRFCDLFTDYMRIWNEYMVYTILGYETSHAAHG